MSKMTIGQCIDAVWQLLNQYSIAGGLTPLSYNSQADDRNRMISLINDAQMEIATTVRPIDEETPITVESLGDKTVKTITMPDGFYRPLQIYFTDHHRHREVLPIDASEYKWIGDETLMLPCYRKGTYEIYYQRYPERYAQNVSLDTELDNKPDTHTAIPYYVAAMIALSDNPKVYYALYNIWETRLSRIGYKRPHAEETHIEDVYGFDRFRGVW